MKRPPSTLHFDARSSRGYGAVLHTTPDSAFTRGYVYTTRGFVVVVRDNRTGHTRYSFTALNRVWTWYEETPVDRARTRHGINLRAKALVRALERGKFNKGPGRYSR